MRFSARILFGLAFVVSLVPFSSPVLAEPAPRPMPWIPIAQWYYSPLQVRLYGHTTIADPWPVNAVYIALNGQIVDGVPQNYPSPQIAAGTWVEVDLAPFIGDLASQADVAFLSGLEVITTGNAIETAIPSITVTFARADDTTANCAKYIGQASAPQMTAGPYNVIGNGTRSNMASVVPLTAGKFKVCLQYANTGNWPDHASYAINLSIQLWGRAGTVGAANVGDYLNAHTFKIVPQ